MSMSQTDYTKNPAEHVVPAPPLRWGRSNKDLFAYICNSYVTPSKNYQFNIFLNVT